MKKFFWLVMVSVLYLMAAGCGSDNSTSSYIISGKVYSVGLDNSETGWPDVTVTLAGDLAATTKTDADGNYNFSVTNGHYVITPSYSGTTFYFPNNEVDVGGAQKNAINFEVAPIQAATKGTSTTRKSFKAGRMDYKTNAAFWTYKDHADESKAITIPGLIKTVVGEKVSTTMVPQGLCFADKYILISAYDSEEKMDSVIYVISKSDRKFRTVLSLGNKAHAGGMAFDGTNIWVCVGKTMGVIKYSTLEKFVENGSPSNTDDPFITSVDVKTTASFATFYNGRVFVGEFNETDTAPMYGYDVQNKDTDKPTLKAAIRMEVPEKSQGVAFRESDGLMIVSMSYGRLNYGSLRFYEPNWNEIDSATVALVHKNDSIKTLTVPPMNEGIVIDGGYTYVLYESGAAEYADGGSYCVYPMNRVLPFRTNGII